MRRAARSCPVAATSWAIAAQSCSAQTTYGATWTRLDRGLDARDFVHVVREDPVRRGLLYAGTEHGVRVSLDGGQSWQSLQLNLPDVQVADLKVEREDLVIASHGRAFWVLDRIAALRQWEPTIASKPVHLFAPGGVYRRVYPAQIDLWVSRAPSTATLEVLDQSGAVVRTLSLPTPLKPGHHRVEWNLRTRGSVVFPGMVLEAASPAGGVVVPPGLYQARLTIDGVAQTQRFAVEADPRLSHVSAADYRAQYELALQLRDATSAANEAVIKIRRMKAELAGAVTSPPDLLARLSAIEGDLYQVKNASPKDKIANPIKLNDRLAGLLSLVQTGDAAPNAAQRAVAKSLIDELNGHLSRLSQRPLRNCRPASWGLAHPQSVPPGNVPCAVAENAKGPGPKSGYSSRASTLFRGPLCTRKLAPLLLLPWPCSSRWPLPQPRRPSRRPRSPHPRHSLATKSALTTCCPTTRSSLSS